jgi:hypothetical protein
MQIAAHENEALLESGEPDHDAKFHHALPFTKPLSKIIQENSDITKLVGQLNSIISANRHDVGEVLNSFTGYDELWKKV